MYFKRIATLATLLIAICAGLFVFYNHKTENLSRSTASNQPTMLKVCGMRYRSDTLGDHAFTGKVVALDDRYIKYEGNISEEQYSVSIVDGCTGKATQIYSGAELPPGTPFVYIPQSKVMLNFIGQNFSDRGVIYYQTIEQLGSTEYKKLTVPLNEGETLVERYVLCGDGCDRETRVFSVRAETDGVYVDVFSQSQVFNDTNPRPLVRTIVLSPSEFNNSIAGQSKIYLGDSGKFERLGSEEKEILQKIYASLMQGRVSSMAVEPISECLIKYIDADIVIYGCASAKPTFPLTIFNRKTNTESPATNSGINLNFGYFETESLLLSANDDGVVYFRPGMKEFAVLPDSSIQEAGASYAMTNEMVNKYDLRMDGNTLVAGLYNTKTPEGAVSPKKIGEKRFVIPTYGADKSYNVEQSRNFISLRNKYADYNPTEQAAIRKLAERDTAVLAWAEYTYRVDSEQIKQIVLDGIKPIYVEDGFSIYCTVTMHNGCVMKKIDWETGDVSFLGMRNIFGNIAQSTNLLVLFQQTEKAEWIEYMKAGDKDFSELENSRLGRGETYVKAVAEYGPIYTALLDETRLYSTVYSRIERAPLREVQWTIK